MENWNIRYAGRWSPIDEHTCRCQAMSGAAGELRQPCPLAVLGSGLMTCHPPATRRALFPGLVILLALWPSAASAAPATTLPATPAPSRAVGVEAVAPIDAVARPGSAAVFI